MKKLKQLLTAIPLGLAVYAGSAQALVINLIPASGMDPLALSGFQTAANRWTSIFSDNVQVNLNVGFSALGTGILGSTSATKSGVTYSAFRNALAVDAKSSSDAIAVANLSASTDLKVYMNGTNVNPAGTGSATPFVDNNANANNHTIYLTNANKRALGLTAAADSVVDGSITFSNLFSFDFNPLDGIGATSFDFVGVATHEIGHALGFISGVDVLDYNRAGNYPDSAFTFISPLDLFRCSADSKAAGADIDWTADKRTKNFSLDKCATPKTTFATGTNFGDGRQASHWKDNLGIGIMEPTFAYGELGVISALDVLAFDVIGWDVGKASVVPEPTSVALFLFGLMSLSFILRRRN